MNRIDAIFADLRKTGRKALMPFVTCGDPDLPTTAALLPALEKAGAAIVELGIPFSDPIADGPVIQASMTYALGKGIRASQVFDTVSTLRARLKVGLIAMVSYTIVHKLGPEAFVKRSLAAGIDGFIFPDLPIEESDAVVKTVRDAGAIASFLIAPTTPPARAEAIARQCSGFVYVLSRSGITGERTELPPDLHDRLRRLRAVTDLPIAVGFGIGNADQVAQVVEVADAAIVGSAIMRRVAEHRGEGSAAVVEQVASLVAELAQGLERPVTGR